MLVKHQRFRPNFANFYLSLVSYQICNSRTYSSLFRLAYIQGWNKYALAIRFDLTSKTWEYLDPIHSARSVQVWLAFGCQSTHLVMRFYFLDLCSTWNFMSTELVWFLQQVLMQDFFDSSFCSLLAFHLKDVNLLQTAQLIVTAYDSFSYVSGYPDGVCQWRSQIRARVHPFI